MMPPIFTLRARFRQMMLDDDAHAEGFRWRVMALFL